MMFYLTEMQVVIIELLAIYGYLTSSQFVKMGLYKRREYLTRSLKPLTDMKKPLILKYNFNPIDGKLESFYYLTKYGKNFLMDELEYSEDQIKFYSGLKSVKLRDYHHRKFCIDFHIYINIWLKVNGGNVNFLNYYFDKAGNNRSNDKKQTVTALNRIFIDNDTSLIPDINTLLEVNEKKYLYLYEQHNGKDAKRLFGQLKKHIIALAKKSASKKYNLKNSHRVVIICEYESVKNSILQQLKNIDKIEFYINFFIFKTNQEIEEDFFNNWTLISGEKTTFLPS